MKQKNVTKEHTFFVFLSTDEDCKYTDLLEVHKWCQLAMLLAEFRWNPEWECPRIFGGIVPRGILLLDKMVLASFLMGCLMFRSYNAQLVWHPYKGYTPSLVNGPPCASTTRWSDRNFWNRSFRNVMVLPAC
jgi:hypothetical protein